MPELALPDGHLHFRRLGAGPPLVLLHGLLGWGAQWQAAAAGLARHFSCWMLELPGISASRAGPDLSLPGLRRWLEQALAALGLERFTLIGSSWGGALALEFATASAQRAGIDRLVLVAPAHPFWTPNRRQRWLLQAPLAWAAAWCGARLPEAAYAVLLGYCYGDRARVLAADARGYHAILRQPGLGAAVAAYGRQWRRDQRRLATQLGSAPPTLLIWGERDRVVPAATAAALQAALPHAELRLLPGLGHIPFAEDPDAFNAAVAPFLAMAPHPC